MIDVTLDFGRGKTDDVRFLAQLKITECLGNVLSLGPWLDFADDETRNVIEKGLSMLPIPPKETLLIANQDIHMGYISNVTWVLNQGWVPTSTSEMISLVFDVNDETFLSYMLLHLNNGKGNFDEYPKVLQDEKALFTFLKELEISDTLKSEFLLMRMNPAHYRKVYIDFFTKTERIVNQLYEEYDELYHRRLKVFDDINLVLKQLDRIREGISQDENQIVISPCFLNTGLICRYRVDDIAYFGLGIGFHAVIEHLTHPKNDISLNNIGKLFSDPNRCDIIDLLTERELFASQISKELKLAANTTSYHMQLLLDAGLLITRQEGKRSLYSLKSEYFEISKKLMEKYSKKIERMNLSKMK